MPQTKMMSFIEAIVNTLVSFWIGIVVNIVVVPIIFGIEANLSQASALTSIFIVVSVVRQYIFRRIFATVKFLQR